MTFVSFKKGRKVSASVMLRLLMASILLSGGFIFRSSPRCLVLAQGGKENDKDKDKNNKNKDKNKDNKDKEKDKNNKDEIETLSPTEQPSVHPVVVPTPPPSPNPTLTPSVSPTNLPTFSPSRKIWSSRLPEISIDIVTIVDDIFEFAALLVDSDQNNLSNANTLNNREGLNAYFGSFVMDLLIASEVVTPSTLDSVDIDVRFLPLDDQEEKQGDVSSMQKASATNRQATNGTPVRIAIKGNMTYFAGADEEDLSDSTEKNQDVILLEDKLSHTLAIYFSFWSTDEMISKLSEYGLTEPKITAVLVDNKLILVAADSNSINGANNMNGDNNSNENDSDSGFDESYVLVVPTDDDTITNNMDLDPMRASGEKFPQRHIHLTPLVTMTGSTILLLFWNVLA